MTCLEVLLPDALLVRPNPVRQRYAAVSCSAHDRQDASAALGRDAGRVEHLHGLFPGPAAGRLCLRPRHDGLAWGAPPGPVAPRRPAAAPAEPEPHPGSRSAPLW